MVDTMTSNPGLVGDAGTKPLRPLGLVLEGDGPGSEANPRLVYALHGQFFFLPPVVATSSPLVDTVESIQRTQYLQLVDVWGLAAPTAKYSECRSLGKYPTWRRSS